VAEVGLVTRVEASNHTIPYPRREQDRKYVCYYDEVQSQLNCWYLLKSKIAYEVVLYLCIYIVVT